MNTVKNFFIMRNLFFALVAVFFLTGSNCAEATDATASKDGVARKERVVIMPEVGPGVKAKAEVELEAEISKSVGTVDVVKKESFVIDDSTVLLTESVHFFDQYGKRTSKEAFKTGDRVLITRSEDRDGIRKLVSLSLMKPKKKAEKAVKKMGQQKVQEVKKVNGVWVN